jgi:hypothetical protein
VMALRQAGGVHGYNASGLGRWTVG